MGMSLCALTFRMNSRALCEVHAAAHRAHVGLLDRRAVGNRVGEGDAQFEDIRAGIDRGLHDGQARIEIRVADHEEGDQGGSVLVLQFGKDLLDSFS